MKLNISKINMSEVNFVEKEETKKTMAFHQEQMAFHQEHWEKFYWIFPYF